MALRYLLNDFGQGTDSRAPVRVEIQIYNGMLDAEHLIGGLPCDPIPADELGPAWTNEDLRAAVAKQTGEAIELPAAVAKAVRRRRR